MNDMIPDLTHYAHGLDPSTFPLKTTTQAGQGDSLSIRFTVVTQECYTTEIALDGQGFCVVSFSAPNHAAPPSSTTISDASSMPLAELPPLSDRQQEALSGLVYETIEALLMAVSPGFEEFFGQELSRKLGAISWDRFQEQDDASDGSDDDTDDKVMS
ncbi:hypothetical protein EDD21DRAFT_362230 [Dissophora ornata]|nr:hypothetical protein BGZ58_009790 [Dissophora ornata]KAI8605989.1 hypothetical protein EDD21DRAFT_362230 [Dissophora ornata]